MKNPSFWQLTFDRGKINLIYQLEATFLAAQRDAESYM